MTTLGLNIISIFPFFFTNSSLDKVYWICDINPNLNYFYGTQWRCAKGECEQLKLSILSEYLLHIYIKLYITHVEIRTFQIWANIGHFQLVWSTRNNGTPGWFYPYPPHLCSCIDQQANVLQKIMSFFQELYLPCPIGIILQLVSLWKLPQSSAHSFCLGTKPTIIPRDECVGWIARAQRVTHTQPTTHYSLSS